MLISIEDLKRIYTEYDFSKYSNERLERKLSAIESAIREYTANSFYNRELKAVVYPEDVIEGCISLLNYDLNVKSTNKIGVASETLSRHSVSYVNRSDANMAMGYPAELVSFLKPYMEWRT